MPASSAIAVGSHHAFCTTTDPLQGRRSWAAGTGGSSPTVVALPFVTHPACLPILFRLWGGKGSASSVELAGRLFGALADTFPGRRIHAVGDAAYHGQPLLAGEVTITTRLPSDAALFALPCLVRHRRPPPDDLAHRLTSEPWCADKTEPAFEDMLGKLRCTLSQPDLRPRVQTSQTRT